MNISIASYSVHGLLAEGKIDIFGYLESCRYRYGLDTADIWNVLLGGIEPAHLTKVRQGLDERELTLVNYHVDGCHLWDKDAEVRRQHKQVALENLEAAAILGAKTVRIDTGGELGPISSEQLDYLTTTYREYCDFGAEHGFKVGPETHWGLSVVVDNMEKIATSVDHPAYGILLHVGHWEIGDPADGDWKLAPYAVHTHVDANVTRNCLEEKIDLLLSRGYTGCWGVEHHSAQNEYAEIAYQLAEVRRVLARKVWDDQNIQSIEQLQGKPGNPALTLEQEGIA